MKTIYADNDMSTEARVSRSIALLDSHAPLNWQEHITKPLSEGDLMSLTECPLGRVYGTWRRGLVALGLATERDGGYLVYVDDIDYYAFAGTSPEVNEWNRQLGLRA